ncbi:MAG: GxxExxY protein, partial [Candidatus Doudnabacteria bacterium]|nr:GxxExxY protein [Candidatus Doudnabacteria bacterium]
LYSVFNELGGGYQEKYYRRAVAIGLKKAGLEYQEQVYVPLTFASESIGSYYLDFLVARSVVLEIKKGDYFAPTNIKQVYAYLQSTGLQLGLLANFTPKGVRVKRIVNVI